MATESTPLQGNKPSYALGVTRARLRLVRNPDTGELYSFMGLCAPLKAFEALGMGSSVHVRVLERCFWLGVLLFLMSVPLRYTGFDPARVTCPEKHPNCANEAETAGGWGALTWYQSIADIAIVIALAVFIHTTSEITMNVKSWNDAFFAALTDPVLDPIHSGINKAATFIENSLSAAPPQEGGDAAAAGGQAKAPSIVEAGAMAIGITGRVSAAFKAEVDKIPSMGAALDASFLVEACSVVVSGWGRGSKLPSALHDAIVAASGAEPVYAVQPMACAAAREAITKLEAAERHLASELQSYKETAAAVSEQAAAKVEKRRGDVAVCNEAVTSAKAAAQAQLLDFAFVTFASSSEKRKVLTAAANGSLWPEGTDAKVTVQPGPNPRDVLWQSLEATEKERAFSSAMFMIIMLVLALVFSSLMALLITLGALLESNTPFVIFSSPEEGQASPATRLGYFCLMFLGILISVQAIIQPIFCVYNDRGVCCIRALRLRCNTYTTLFAKAGSFSLWIEFIINCLIFWFHLFLTIRDSAGYHIATTLCHALGVPEAEINFYWLYNQEVAGNIMLAGLVEIFVMTWLFSALGRYLVAPFQKTQANIDHHCRMTDPFHLPFSTSDGMRIIAAASLWCGIFPIATMWLCIYYPIAIFVVRTNLLGRFEPGPPTKTLQYRFVFTIYLPLHLLLHLVLCYGLYADTEVPDPEEIGAGIWPGFKEGTGFRSPPKAFHSVMMILVSATLLVVVPYAQHKSAKREGVMTPWELCKLFFTEALDDADFGTSSRTCVGVHHHTSPEFFGRDAGDEPVPVVRLPTDLPAGAGYEPPCSVDLTAEEGAATK